MIFVDTGAWYALFVSTDKNHDAATAWFGSKQHVLVTTDAVVVETLTLLRARGHNDRAVDLGLQLLVSKRLAILHTISEAEFMAAWDVFYRYADKAWSFTDCTSFVVINRLKIETAFAFDQHFHQFNTVAVVP